MRLKASAAAWLVSAALLSSWAVSWASDETKRRDTAAGIKRGSALPAEAVEAARQVARLAERRYLTAHDAMASARNPFAFGGERVRVRPATPAASHRNDVPVIAAEIESAEVEIAERPTLAAVAEVAGGGTTAVISFGGELHYAARGALIADRYRVDAIFEGGVDIFDLSLGMNLRLTLRQPR